MAFSQNVFDWFLLKDHTVPVNEQVYVSLPPLHPPPKSNTCRLLLDSSNPPFTQTIGPLALKVLGHTHRIRQPQ